MRTSSYEPGSRPGLRTKPMAVLGVVLTVGFIAYLVVLFVRTAPAFDSECDKGDRTYLLSRAADVAPKTGGQGVTFIDDCSMGDTGSANWDSTMPKDEVTAVLADHWQCRPVSEITGGYSHEFSCVVQGGDVLVWLADDPDSYEMGITRNDRPNQ